jgi:hypothetical protein
MYCAEGALRGCLGCLRVYTSGVNQFCLPTWAPQEPIAGSGDDVQGHDNGIVCPMVPEPLFSDDMNESSGEADGATKDNDSPPRQQLGNTSVHVRVLWTGPPRRWYAGDVIGLPAGASSHEDIQCEQVLQVEYDDGTSQSHNFGQAGQHPTQWERLYSNVHECHEVPNETADDAKEHADDSGEESDVADPDEAIPMPKNYVLSCPCLVSGPHSISVLCLIYYYYYYYYYSY